MFMKNMKIEVEGYTVDNTDFLGFVYENSSEDKKILNKEKFYVYCYMEENKIIDYEELEMLTGISINKLRVWVHRLKCRKNGI